MTGSERDVLMRFLRKLIQTKPLIYDEMAAKLIEDTIISQPYAAYLLVQRALMVEIAVGAAKPELDAFTEFLSANATVWSGDRSNIDIPIVEKSPPARRLSLVEIGLKAMARNSKLIWTVIFAAFAIVLIMRL